MITVILDNTDISGVYGDMLFADGAAEVTLRHGESALAEGLPAGTAYTVTEKGAEADGYTVTSQGAEGEISPGEISEVSFETIKMLCRKTEKMCKPEMPEPRVSSWHPLWLL